MTGERNPTRCCDGKDACGAETEDPERAGWHLLPITGRWRCPACVTNLVRANVVTEAQALGADSTMEGLEP